MLFLADKILIKYDCLNIRMGKFRSKMAGPALCVLAVGVVFAGYNLAKYQSELRVSGRSGDRSSVGSGYKSLKDKLLFGGENLLDSKYYLMLESQDSALAAAYQMANDRSDRDKVRGIRERKYGVDFSDLMGGWVENVNGPHDKARIGIFPDRVIAIKGKSKNSTGFNLPVTFLEDTYIFDLRDGNGTIYARVNNDMLSLWFSERDYSKNEFMSFRKVVK